MAWLNMFNKQEKLVEEIPTAPSMPMIPSQPITSVVSFPASMQETSNISEKSKEPFFVRLDKFNDAKDNLQSISKRLKEMDRMFDKISETKAKEDEELASCKDDIKGIRDYLAQVDSDIFNKL
jgi:hypothetical protein